MTTSLTFEIAPLSVGFGAVLLEPNSRFMLTSVWWISGAKAVLIGLRPSYAHGKRVDCSVNVKRGSKDVAV